SVRAGRQGAGKRPHGARSLSVRGQEAVGVQEALGLLQAARGGAGRQGVPVRQGFWLPADEIARRSFVNSAIRYRPGEGLGSTSDVGYYEIRRPRRFSREAAAYGSRPSPG